MAIAFADYFGGEHAGYDLLYQNMKHGLNASRELSDFLRERSSIEESIGKLLVKLAKAAPAGAQQGSFAPLWAALRAEAERLAIVHQHGGAKLAELVRDVGRYADELARRHRQVKESEAGTLDAALQTQAARAALQKASDLFASKSAEAEKLREQGAPSKDLDRLEAKLRKLGDESTQLREKYVALKADFDRRMALTCRRFQDLEEAHLKRMKQFVDAYVDLVQSCHDLIGHAHVELKHRCLELTVEKLLESFVLDKCGALERAKLPEMPEPPPLPLPQRPRDSSFASKTSRRTTSLLNLFTPSFQSRDEATVDAGAACSAPSSPSGAQAAATARAHDKSDDSQMGRNPLRESRWFLRSKRNKAKLKKAKKKKDGTIATAEGSDLDEKEEEIVQKEDEVEPDRDDPEPGVSPEPERPERVTAPPDPDADADGAYSTSDSDSEEERERKIHVEIKPLSESTAPMSASVDELLATVENLTLPGARRGSGAGAAFRSPNGPASPLGLGFGPTLSESPTENDDRRPAIAIPRPPSRRSEPGEFRTTSRGPSPLTIGMADTVPLAVAFHEIIHSYFRGADETNCQTKMSGDMMLSFPTGIVGVLANNPNPARLRFRLKNAHRLDMTPNRQLVSLESTPGSRECRVEFDMAALAALLRRQSEKNPGAAYFNVDILKYQIKPEPGASSCPFQLVSYWKRERSHTDLKIDYKYNAHAMSSPSPLLNLAVTAPVAPGYRRINSKPACQSTPNSLVWKFTELSQHSDDRGVGSLKARIELDDGPSLKGTVSAQFNCEGATLSGVEFELVGPGYRLSLVKRRFVSGKYICDGD